VIAKKAKIIKLKVNKVIISNGSVRAITKNGID